MQQLLNSKYFIQKEQRGTSQLTLLFVLIVLLVFAGVAAANRQNLYDWIKLRGYTAPAPIADLANQGAFTDHGTKIFYVNHPELESKQDFVASCPASVKEQTIVLGCYHGNQRGIFLLDVTDQRLNGVEQVTAAHEMLHAAYDRLSNSDRKKIDGLLQQYYQSQLKDERIKKTIDAYKKTEPNDLLNEMHSIFATEIANLPIELEAHYRKYFTNRKQVVAYAERYQSEFSSRHDAVARADARLAELKQQIEQAERELRTTQAEVEARRAALLAARNSNNVEQYNAGVPAYNALVDNYNVKVRAVQSLVQQYNALVNERNAIAIEEGELINELKTNVDTIQQ